MAQITLNPGEAFEHTHNFESLSTHVKGKLELLVNGEILPMEEYKTYKIAAKVSHTIRNIGNTVGTFDCSSHLTEGANK